MINKNRVVFAILLIICLLCFSFVIFQHVSKEQNSDIYEELQELNDKVEVSPTSPTSALLETDISEKPEIPINFAEIISVNSDIYSWIRIPGTDVDYPVLQSLYDDSYYLNHSADRSEGLPGAIYTESINSQDFTDRNTVIYGHDMKNGSMFGGLSDYLDINYFKEHSEIIIYTPENIFTYRVFGAVTYDNRHIMNSFDFSTDVGFNSFIESIYSVRNMNTIIDEDIKIDSEDKIITLSTCNGNSNQRFLILAVLIDEQ